MLLLLLDLHIAQHIIPNSTVAPTHHVSISNTFFFSKFSKIYFFKNFCAPFPGPLGLLPLIFEFPYSPYISHIFSQLSTSILTSFFTVLPHGLTQTSYVLLALHPRMPNLWAQPINGPPHSWKRWSLTSTVTPTPLYSFFSFSPKSKMGRTTPITTRHEHPNNDI